MAESHNADDDALLETIDSFAPDGSREFVRTALPKIATHLTSNREQAKRMTDVETGVSDVLDVENVREIQVRAEPLENPRVTVWLSDCPMWANDAWSETFYPEGPNAYNGKVRTTFDVRQQ